MSVFPCHWTIVSLLKTHCYLPFSTICPSLQAHGSIKWTGLETMLRTRWFDATWLCHLKWPPKHREQLHHTERIHKSSFHKAVKITSSSGCGRVAAAVVDAPDLKGKSSVLRVRASVHYKCTEQGGSSRGNWCRRLLRVFCKQANEFRCSNTNTQMKGIEFGLIPCWSPVAL